MPLFPKIRDLIVNILRNVKCRSKCCVSTNNTYMNESDAERDLHELRHQIKNQFQLMMFFLDHQASIIQQHGLDVEKVRENIMKTVDNINEKLQVKYIVEKIVKT